MNKAISRLTGITIIIIVILAGIATWFAFYGTTPQQITTTKLTCTITLGGNLEWTGQEASVNIWKERGVSMAIENLNSRGGILGCIVKYLLYDSALDTSRAVSIANRLIDVDKVPIIIAIGATVTSQAMIPVAESRGVPIFVMFAPASIIRQKLADPTKYPHTLILSGGTYFYQIAFLNFLASLPEDKRPKTIAVIGRNDVVGTDSMFTIKEWLQNHPGMFKIVAEEYFQPGITDLKPILSKIQPLNPDVLMCNTYMGESILIIKGLKELGWKPKMLWFHVGPQQPEWITQLGKDGYYVFASTPYIYRIPTKGNQELDNATLALYNTHAVYGQGTAYAMIEIIAQAIERAGSTDPAKIIEVMFNGTFNTIVGNVTFINGVAQLPHFVVQIINGTPEIVWPLEYRTHEPIIPMP